MAVASDYKISPADVQAVHVEAQPDILRGSTTQNKQVFDKYSDMIVEHFNNLCDVVDDNTSAVVDSGVLILYASLGWIADEQ